MFALSRLFGSSLTNFRCLFVFALLLQNLTLCSRFAVNLVKTPLMQPTLKYNASQSVVMARYMNRNARIPKKV